MRENSQIRELDLLTVKLIIKKKAGIKKRARWPKRRAGAAESMGRAQHSFV